MLFSPWVWLEPELITPGNAEICFKNKALLILFASQIGVYAASTGPIPCKRSKQSVHGTHCTRFNSFGQGNIDIEPIPQ
jgi:hypothetical protein